MEVTEINAETSVLEETYEDVGSDTGTASSSSGEESTGDDILSGSDAANSVMEESSLDEHGESREDDEMEVITETVVQTVEVLPEQPIAVYLVDEPLEGASTYAVNGDVYPGTISTTYTDYFTGIADKLSYDEHYVVFRQSQYVYKMMWGDSLSLSGSDFTGDSLSYCSLTTNSGYNSDFMVEFGEDSLNIDASGGFVYSDLGNYPSLTEGVRGIESQTLLFAVGFAVV